MKRLMNRLTLLAAAVQAVGSLAAKAPEYRQVEARENAQKPEWKSYEAKTVDRPSGFQLPEKRPQTERLRRLDGRPAGGYRVLPHAEDRRPLVADRSRGLALHP